MPDAISTVNGVHQFAYNDRPGWHGLGVKVPEGMNTSENIMKFANLDTPFQKAKIFIKSKEEGFIQVDDQYCIVRLTDGRPFGIVGKQYEILQPWEAFDAVDALAMDGRMRYETAGALHEGRTLFILGLMGEDFLVGGADPVRPYVLLTTSYDGRTSTTIRDVSTRVVCANTMRAAMREEKNKELSVRHTSTQKERLAEAARIFEITSKTQQQMFQAFDKLAQMKADLELREKVADIITPPPAGDETERSRKRKQEERLAFWRSMQFSPTVRAAGGVDNRWGLLNAATEWLDWVQPRRGQDILKSEGALEKRMLFSLEGDGSTKRQQVFSLLSRELTAV